MSQGLNSLQKEIQETIEQVLLEEKTKADADLPSFCRSSDNEVIDAILKNNRFRTKLRGAIIEIVREALECNDLVKLQKSVEDQKKIIEALSQEILKRRKQR